MGDPHGVPRGGLIYLTFFHFFSLFFIFFSFFFIFLEIFLGFYFLSFNFQHSVKPIAMVPKRIRAILGYLRPLGRLFIYVLARLRDCRSVATRC